MSSKKFETSLESPGKAQQATSWTVSILSVCFVLGLLYVGEMISRGYYYARLQTVLSSSLNSDSDLVFTADNPEFSQLFVARDKDIKVLKPILSFVAQKDPERAAAILSRHQLEHSPLNAQLEKTLEELSALSDSSEELAEESSKSQDALATKRAEYNQLKADFRSYLGGEASERPAITAAPQDENTFCKFYQGGLAAGLPMLPSLPEDISDFSQLATYFTLIKSGETSAPSASTAQKELEVLRDRGEYLRSECEGLNKRTEEIKVEQEQNNSKQAELYAAAKVTLRKILISLATPQVDNQTVVAYDLFRSSVEKYGFKLPTLWV